MTTKVTVEAHCNDATEVRVACNGDPEVVMQNGESVQFYVYDDRMVSVREVPKQSSSEAS